MANTKRLPFSIGSEIFLRPLGDEKEVSKAASRILGARPEEFLIIDDPIIRVSERFTVPVTGSVLCWYLYEGEVYRFQSDVLKSLGEGLTLIRYPSRHQCQSLRKHQRVRVNIETVFSSEGAGEEIRGAMQDISEGGCRVLIPSLIALGRNASCAVGFTLPDGQQVRRVDSVVRGLEYSKIRRTTLVRVEFTGPPAELGKISSFCHYCMFFKV